MKYGELTKFNKLVILCEGQTEFNFVTNIIRPYFNKPLHEKIQTFFSDDYFMNELRFLKERNKDYIENYINSHPALVEKFPYLNPDLCNLQVVPRMVNTQLNQGKSFYFQHGGVSSFNRIISDFKSCVNQFSNAYITSLLDYYRFPETNYSENVFESFRKSLNGEINDYVKDINILKKNPNHIEFNFMYHEMETVLFSDISKFSHIFGVNNFKFYHKDILNKLKVKDYTKEKGGKALATLTQILKKANGMPEKIQNPSVSILNAIPSYVKPVHGIMIAKEIGMETMMEKCPVFGSWIKSIESAMLKERKANLNINFGKIDTIKYSNVFAMQSSGAER